MILTGRLLDIVEGRTELPEEKVAAYRALFAARMSDAVRSTTPMPATAPSLDCRHRGAKLRDELHRHDGQVATAVHACTVYGECILRHSAGLDKNLQACDQCVSRTSLETRSTFDVPCRFRGAETRHVSCKSCQNNGVKALPVYNCQAFGDECILRGSTYSAQPLRVCLTCKQRQVEKTVRMRVQCDATLFDHASRPVRLTNAHRGGFLFIVGGGPSLLEMPIELLSRRGVVTLGLNNSPSIVKPTMWVAMDSAAKFLESTWWDSTIQKFFPLHRRNEVTRRRDARGALVTDRRVHQHPNVSYYKRSQGDFNPVTFFSSGDFHWGCSDKHKDPSGTHGVRSVMFPAMKLAYYLGFSTVFFAGCDFRMREDKPYAFEQAKAAGQVRYNNRLYTVVMRRIEMLRPTMDKIGLRFINVTPGSRLAEIMESWSLDRAVDMATRSLSTPASTQGMY